jgi:hypothetical protein
MKNADQIYAESSALARVPAFSVKPPARCMTEVEPSAHQKCGELATVIRRGGKWFADSFHCSKHREPTDLAIAGDYMVRRVRVTCDVLLAGVDDREGICKAEAAARLAAAVAAAGGVLDVKMVTSQIGRYSSPAGASGVKTAPGSRE